MTDLTFKKREHIVSTRLIEQLFGSGNQALAAYPMRAVSCMVSRALTGLPVQVLISVSKRHFKHAVDRNRVKRQVREAYRCQKNPLFSAVPSDKCLLVAFVWLSDELVPSEVVNSRMGKLIRRLTERLQAEDCSKDRVKGSDHE